MAVVAMSNLLEAGVHFGHQTKRWNPKMKEYIFSTRDDIYIMDLQKTTEKLEEAFAENEDTDVSEDAADTERADDASSDGVR